MDPPFAPGSIVAEKYEVIALAGEGGMGQLYRTRELLLDRPVALKVMYSSLVGDRKSLSRFDREGRLLSKLLHPNIPHSIEFATLYQRERPVIPEDTDVLIDPKDQRTMDMIIGRLAPE